VLKSEACFIFKPIMTAIMSSCAVLQVHRAWIYSKRQIWLSFSASFAASRCKLFH